MLPLEVLQQAQAEFVDYNGCGMSVTEMSHRSKQFDAIHNECIALIRELMGVPDNYEVLLVQGGASTQFAAIPMNLLSTGKADYVVTGNFAKKAYKEALKYGDIHIAGSSEADKFTYIPKTLDIRDDADYLYICQNNTIFGTRFSKLPECKMPLVADISSNILSEEMDVSKYGVLYAGAQKNLAPAYVLLPHHAELEGYGGKQQPLQHSPLLCHLYGDAQPALSQKAGRREGNAKDKRIQSGTSLRLYRFFFLLCKQGEQGRSLLYERAFQHPQRGFGRGFCQAGRRKRLCVHQGSQACGRHARFHIQRYARGRHNLPHRIYEGI